MFRFLDQQGPLSRFYFFPGQLAWPLLQAEYLQQLPPSTGSISFSMDTGQRLAPGLLCRDLDHFFGVATLFVDAILTTAPPALSTTPPPAPTTPPPSPTPDKEPEPKGITASSTDPVKKRPQRKRTYPVTPEVTFPGDPQQRKQVRELCKGDPDEILTPAQLSSPLARKILRVLPDKEWLGDEIINNYMELINQRDLALHDGKRTIYALSCYFFNLLSVNGYDYQRVRKWPRRAGVDVFLLEKIILPINVDNKHWILAVVNLKRSRFECFDSLGGRHPNVPSRLRRWLKEESLDKRGVELSLDGWQDHQGSCPQQKNDIDCGVFVCRFAECAAFDGGFDFSQKDISNLRFLMALQLVNAQLP